MYSGAPITKNKPRRKDFELLLETINDQVNAWGTKALPLPARLTLAKSILQTSNAVHVVN